MSSGKKRVTTYPPNSAALQMEGNGVLAEASQSRRACGLLGRLGVSCAGAACRADLGGSSSNLCVRHKRLEKGFIGTVVDFE